MHKSAVARAQIVYSPSMENTVCGNFGRSCISRKASLKDFGGLVFADQVEYSVLSHYLFLRIKISRSASLQ